MDIWIIIIRISVSMFFITASIGLFIYCKAVALKTQAEAQYIIVKGCKMPFAQHQPILDLPKTDTETSYMIGQKQALIPLLQQCFSLLGYDDPASENAKWILEREAAVIALRNICGKHGDNDWPNDLDLADIIEKHLHCNLGY